MAVTGAAGQIGYAILFRIASGQLLGPDTPVHLSLLEIPAAVKAAEGTAMELDDCAFPLLAGVDIYDDPNQAFDGVSVALLVGARPRSKGMERGDLLEANGGIFKPQGEALNAHAASDVKVLVVGNPANTNCLIAQSNAPDIPRERFTAMMRLDHNRAIAQVANKTGAAVSDVTNMTIWGNHSATPVPGRVPRQGQGLTPPPRRSATRAGSRATSSPPCRSAGRRSSRPAAPRARPRPPTPRSITSTTGCWARRTVTGCRWRSHRTAPTESRKGIFSGYPCTCSGGEYSIVEGLDLDEFSRARIDATVGELRRGARRGQAARPDLDRNRAGDRPPRDSRPPRST